MRKTHKDRIAFIDHLEKKYSQKIERSRQGKQKRSLKQQLRMIRGVHIDDPLEYEVSDVILSSGRRMAY